MAITGSGAKSRYRMATLSSLIQSGQDIDDILGQMDKLVDSFPSHPCPGNDMGADEKWRRLMLELPSYVYCLMYGATEIAGYWSCFPVKKDLYEAGLRGENINKSIDMEDIEDFAFPGDYSCYFVDFFVYKHHRGFATNPIIYESFRDFIKVAAKKGYFIEKIFAHTSSYDSINLCSNAGFSLVVDHIEHRMIDKSGSVVPTKIYEIDFRLNENPKLLTLDGGLHDIYRRHFANRATAESKALNRGNSDLSGLIAKGENHELEFKQTLRWDPREGRVNKGLEDVVIKTVAAFANSHEGGTLLIGVTDSGEAVGLEDDYAALGDADRDRFQLHLRNLFGESFGQSFTSAKLRVSFPHVGDAEICQIDVSPADHAVVVQAKDKNGVRTEKLYVRSGNSSPEIPLSEVQAFLAQRFGKS